MTYNKTAYATDLSIEVSDPSALSRVAAVLRRQPVRLWRGAALLVGIAILTFPPFVMHMSAGLDQSWMIGLHEARLRGLVFGRDIGFTYGPLGRMLFPFNEGTALTTPSLMLLALYAAWWTSVALVMAHLRGTATVALFVAGIVTCGMMDQHWATGIASIPMQATAGFLVGANLSRRSWWALPAVVLTAVGLLSKFNIGVGCLGCLLAYLAASPLRVGVRRAILQGALFLALLAAAFSLLFYATNGDLTHIPSYLSSYWLMSLGYSSQMSMHLWSEDFLLLLACGVGVCLLVPLLERRTWASYAPLLLIVSFPLFMTYKSAVVRCDVGHVLWALPGLITLLCLLLPAELGRWGTRLFRHLIPAVALASLLGVAFTRQDPLIASPSFLFAGPRNFIQLLRWEHGRDSFRASSEAFRASQALPPELRARIGDATVDVYPWDICLITANRLNWSPRYVLQSYQAFHPALDELGAEHYRGPRAPRFILYRHQAIDGQHPCLVDPRTWLELYRWYDPAANNRTIGLVLLERRASPRFGRPELIGSRAIGLNEELALPRSGDALLLLEADVRLSAIGRIKEQLYKMYPPNLRIVYANGDVVERRLVWRNLAGGGLVGELPRDPDAATAALRGERPDRVRSVTFLSNPRSGFVDRIYCKLYTISMESSKG